MNKSSVYEIITERMVSLLESGTVPWKKSWAGSQGLPRNAVSGKEYRGINVFLLACAGYADNRWVTFKQAVTLKGSVRKGEKGMPVVFWKKFDPKDKESKDPKDRGGMMLRYYTVFNVSQCDGLALPPPTVDETPGTANERDDHADRVVVDYVSRATVKGRALVIHHGQTGAYYDRDVHVVGLPNLEKFFSMQEYYGVLFHELTHSTGHHDLLGRFRDETPTQFSRMDYSREELVAEMGAAFLSAVCRFSESTIENSAAYIKGWLKALKDDPKAVVIAAAQAQKAADLILGRKFGVESE